MCDKFEEDINYFYNFIKDLQCYNCGSCLKGTSKSYKGCSCDKLFFFTFENLDRYSIFLKNYYLIINLYKNLKEHSFQCFIFKNKNRIKILTFDYLPNFIINYQNDPNINYSDFIEDKISILLSFK